MADFEIHITNVDLSSPDFEVVMKEAFENQNKELLRLRRSDFYKEIEQRNNDKGLEE